jgi:hypothetical protein
MEMSLPINKIGEKNWVNKLSDFLEKCDIEVMPLEDQKLIIETEEKLKWTFPYDIKEYYSNFGGIKSSDFMYNLKHLKDYILLSDSIWEFVLLNFDKEITDNYIVFSTSPSNEPLCINKNTNEIFLFSHDPLKYAKVYNDFNDYLISEIISIQELFGYIEFKNNEYKIKYTSNLLKGNNIDYKFRNMKIE